MTRYKQIQAKAQANGIDTRQDKYCTPRGYWVVDKEGNNLWDDGSFAGSLKELNNMIDEWINQ